MKKDESIYLSHMLETAQKAISFLEGKHRAEYDADEILRFALTHLLQIIGEAANHVSEDFREAHPEILWYQIIGLRNRVVHDYIRVDYNVVWETVK